MNALIIVDVQNGLLNKDFYKKEVFLQTINKAIIESRKKNNLIIFIQHNSVALKKGSCGWQVYSGFKIKEDDVIIQKTHGSAFKNTNLKQILYDNKIIEITVCGLVSHCCVFHTCKDGIKNGFKVKLLKDGHANWHTEAENKINEINKKVKSMGAEII
jgi:nicotinamidase-related amidase